MKSFVITSLTLLFAACAPNNSENQNSLRGPEVGGIVEILSQSELQCGKSDVCPADVGMVVIRMNDSLGQCTGTLVAPDLVLTNSHCIPQDLKDQPNANCNDFLGFVKRDDKALKQIASCQELVYFSILSAGAEGNADIDFALFRISHALVRPNEIHKISRNGFSDMASYHIYAVDPIDNELGVPDGNLVRKDCLAVFGSLLVPEFNSKLSPLVSFFGDSCHVIGGNSGSSIRSENDDILGVMNKGHRPGSQSSGLFHNSKNVVPESFGLGINFACLALKGVDELIPSACPQTNSITDKNFQGAFDKSKIEEQELAEVSKYVSGLTKQFLFKVQLKSVSANDDLGLMGAVEFSATPVCLRPKGMWPKESKIEKRKVLHSMTEEFVTISTRSEVLGVSISTDQFLRAKLDMHASTTGTRVVEVKLNASSKGDLKAIEKSNALENGTAIEMHWCSPEEATMEIITSNPNLTARNQFAN